MARRLQVGNSTVADDTTLKVEKLTNKDLGKSIGSDPDEWDERNIQSWIDLYEKAYPGRIGAMAQDVKTELALSGRSKDFGEISKASEMRLSMWLPVGLQEIMERAYPSFWTNKKHLSWFLRKFPQFKSAPKH